MTSAIMRRLPYARIKGALVRILSFYSRQLSRMRSRPCPAGVPPPSRFPHVGGHEGTPRAMLSNCATGASHPFQKRYGSVSEAFQAKAAKIAHMDQCTVGADRRHEEYEYYSYDTINE